MSRVYSLYLEVARKFLSHDSSVTVDDEMTYSKICLATISEDEKYRGKKRK